MTYREFLQKVQGELGSIYDAEEAESMSRMLIEDASGSSMSRLRSLEREEVPEPITFKVYRYMQGLLDHTPLQYVLGYAWFYKRKFLVNPSVLIPRRETEELVYRVIREMRGRKASILDVGTGSGCIAISLKLEMPEAEMQAIDISQEALNTAGKNAGELGAEVSFSKADILDHKQWSNFGQFDAIVSNPPYITEEEKAAMPKNVLEHEPQQALFVTNGDPQQYYKAIAGFGKQHLREKGLLFFECNETYAVQTVEMLKTEGFINIELMKDMQGKDRILQAQKN
jgi:release factor glutamine methyltransferase